MKLTLKAILARWNGDRKQAIDYCYSIIDKYPHLRDEYSAVVDLLTSEGKAKAYAN